ncbi:MAG: ribonuclease T2 [Rudaea sp.]|nr:ribonuclease T2 [Rudaea sp.]
MSLARVVASVSILCVLVAAGAGAHGHGNRDGGGDTPGRFDYYLMSLSWSPSFCETHQDQTEQCGSRGFGFVLHGLWPQNRNGSWPQNCSGGEKPDAATIARAMAFMPSRQLIEHEWQTHGACTGLDAEAYFALADRAFAAVKVPPALSAPQSPPDLSAADVVQAFIQVNPGLDQNMISIACHNGSELAEVRVCLNKDDLSPQACGGRVRNSCRYGALRIPAMR